MTLSAESIDGNTEKKAKSIWMVGCWVRGKGSRLRDPTLLSPVQATSEFQMRQGTLDLWVGE